MKVHRPPLLPAPAVARATRPERKLCFSSTLRLLIVQRE